MSTTTSACALLKMLTKPSALTATVARLGTV